MESIKLPYSMKSFDLFDPQSDTQWTPIVQEEKREVVGRGSWVVVVVVINHAHASLIPDPRQPGIGSLHTPKKQKNVPVRPTVQVR